MQEDVENRTVNVVVSTTKFTGRTIAEGLRIYLRHRQNKKFQKTDEKKALHGKMSVKQLIGQGQGVSNIEVTDGSVGEFCRCAKKYGVDYAVKKDSTLDPPRYLVFFKAKDLDALNAVMRDYMKKMMNKAERPSVLKQLNKFKEMVAAVPKKVREKVQEHTR